MSPASLELRILDSLSLVQEEAWDGLLDEQCTPFQKHRWLSALEEGGSATPETGWHPRHLTLWRGASLVAAAAAYVREDSQGEFVFDHGWAEAARRGGIGYYPKLTLAVPFTPATGRRLLVAKGEAEEPLREALLRAALELSASAGLSSVHMLFPSPDEAKLGQRAGGALRHGIQYHWDNDGYGSYDDFLARFHSKGRHMLRREARGPESQGIVLRTRRASELTQADAALAYRLYLSTVDKFAWGRRYLTESFFDILFSRFREHIELVEAIRDDRVIAGAFNVASATHLYGRYWGCFEEHPYLHFNVCYYHSIQECIRRGLRRFEGGAGGSHKVSRGFSPVVTQSLHWMHHERLHDAVERFVTDERGMIDRELPRLRAGTGMRPRRAQEGEDFSADLDR